MKALFDNNLPQHLAHAIRELSKPEIDVEEIIHLRDRFDANTPDVQWIAALVGAWVIVSIDRFSKSEGAERAALARAGNTIFVLDRQWFDQTYWLKAERLVRWWPQILGQARMAQGGFRVPWNHTSKSKFLTIRL